MSLRLSSPESNLKAPMRALTVPDFAARIMTASPPKTPGYSLKTLAGMPTSLSLLLLLACAAQPVFSYPQFQQFSEKHSGRPVDCAMCHSNESGPQGTGEGQIGSLDAEAMKRLNKARAAMEPQSDVNSPILNSFGNEIIRTLGKRKVLECMANPAKLAEFLGEKKDLDEDGIPDGQEFLDGTDPTNKFHGDPWKLFVANLNKYKAHVILAVLAIFALDFGFAHILKGMTVAMKTRSVGKDLHGTP
ncbi:MAG TPA: hypothetical protein V6D17_25065 [Candidatus Obscuribacterales bacterium]